MTSVPVLDLDRDVVSLTADLVDIPSESRSEGPLADAVEAALRRIPHLRVDRDGDTVVARTSLSRPSRVLIGGHLDTVPSAGNLPHTITDGAIHGLGSCDMKGGVAVGLRLAAMVDRPVHDVTYVFYECEEIDARFNGLARLAETHPDWLAADFAILMEPSRAGIEAGCQGTVRAQVRTTGVRAHSARSWLGRNAIHEAGQILHRLEDYEPRRVSVDGLEYREGLNAVGVEGGIAGNVIPDACVVTVNYRFAPTRTVEEAERHVRDVFEGFDVEIVDRAAGALPGLDRPAAAEFIASVGAEPRPKFGWTDVARFSALGVPAVNYGPGDPSLAHAVDERVPIADLVACERVLSGWLSGRSTGVTP